MSGKNVDRREFVRKSVTAAGAVAAGVAAVGTVRACPLRYDANGNIEEWWCIVDEDPINPIFSLYTWENCLTLETDETIGPAGRSFGNCSNPENDVSCVTNLNIDSWQTVVVNGSSYKIPDDVPNEIRDEAIRVLSLRPKGS